MEGYIPKKLGNARFSLLLFPLLSLKKTRNRAGYYSFFSSLGTKKSSHLKTSISKYLGYTPRQIVEKIHQKKADSILSVKDNQKNLQDEIKDYFIYMKNQHADSVAKSTYTETDSGHGRIEQRTYRQLLVNQLISEASKWAGIRTI